MYLPFKTSKRRIREAENARKNRAEIVKALSQGQINRLVMRGRPLPLSELATPT